ncbi:MAG: WD40 repeat domain-containing protein, partial [Microcystis sp. M49629_WE12]|nr:WD40 repeat domain-containing protein [Microcystis sp. M49629_WE12]
MSEPSEIQQNITEAQYAATSGTGNATITITNYYYREEARIAPADSADVADDNLPCPYRGLFHFGPGDAEYFFGRKSFITNLFQATQTRNFIPLLGASGSGKSSVVFAGLVPKLQQEGHWQFTHFRPGSDPFHALALALVPLYTTNLNETERLAQARQLANYLRDGDIPLADVFAQIQHNYPSERVLLIADQFEELYTLCPDETIRRNFLDKLTTFPFERVGMVLVLTMRADFLGNALSYRPFADVLQNTDLKLGPMNREELTEVIEKPAQKLGVILEAGLVERILDDVESEPGNLPLLEFALTELWQRRQGQQLTHLAYTEIGQVQGALARHANEEYDKLSEAQREQVRRIFIQLVRPGEGTEDTRRLATKAELGAVNWALVKQLADARLVVTSRSEEAQVETVEVVHEALIRNWGELRGWMDTDRVFRAWQERLRGAMGQWQKTQGDEGSWLRGAALAEAEEQLKKRPEDISQSEQDFIRQSLQER